MAFGIGYFISDLDTDKRSKFGIPGIGPSLLSKHRLPKKRLKLNHEGPYGNVK
jgi:hypothetical protein